MTCWQVMCKQLLQRIWHGAGEAAGESSNQSFSAEVVDGPHKETASPEMPGCVQAQVVPQIEVQPGGPSNIKQLRTTSCGIHISGMVSRQDTISNAQVACHHAPLTH